MAQRAAGRTRAASPNHRLRVHSTEWKQVERPLGEYSAESDWSWGEYAVERVDLSRTGSMCCHSQLVAEWLYPQGPIGCDCHCAGFHHFKCNLQSLGGFWLKCTGCDNRYDPACKNVADALPIKLASGGPWRHRWTAS